MKEQNEKQAIEEMAQVMCDDCAASNPPCEHKMCDAVLQQAKALYNAGYRKQSVGEWKFRFTLDDDDFYECSICGRQEVISGLCYERNPVEYFPYCHCGARMKGGE